MVILLVTLTILNQTTRTEALILEKEFPSDHVCIVAKSEYVSKGFNAVCRTRRTLK